MDSALRSLLLRRPDALVMAAGPDGQFVPVPASLGITPDRVPGGRSAIDLVQPADHLTVIEAWQRTKTNGGARATVHLAGPDAPLAWLHLFDVTETLGVHVCVMLIENDACPDAVAPTPIARPMQPRSVRARKDEWAFTVAVEDEVTAMLGWTPEEMVG
ncbi:MAG: domain S-box-containing protein/diguanylate cyclase protein, partial [Acidimicrobiia bacterium]|nr:domain S-box-containing protein/diguanylate cyclase protein [Acidimicrobiia bacterium]